MIWIGTSGYNYPSGRAASIRRISGGEDAAVYAERFPTVEINYTFYRMPNEAGGRMGGADAVAVQADAQGAAPHHARQPPEELRRARPDVLPRGRHARRQARALLFQLPPNLKKDLAVFDAFLEELPPRVCAAFEFRHASWLEDDVFERLVKRNLALCVADSEKMSAPVRVTADYAYFRLRDEGYTPDDIKRWGDTIARETASCRDVFVYFKHEEEGKGPEFARLLRDRLGV